MALVLERAVSRVRLPGPCAWHFDVASLIVSFPSRSPSPCGASPPHSAGPPRAAPQSLSVSCPPLSARGSASSRPILSSTVVVAASGAVPCWPRQSRPRTPRPCLPGKQGRQDANRSPHHQRRVSLVSGSSHQVKESCLQWLHPQLAPPPSRLCRRRRAPSSQRLSRSNDLRGVARHGYRQSHGFGHFASRARPLLGGHPKYRLAWTRRSRQ